MRRYAPLLGFALVLGMPWACSLPDVNLEGRPCPCTDGYVCDPATNTCVSSIGSTGAGASGGDGSGAVGLAGAGGDGVGGGVGNNGGTGLTTGVAAADWTTKMAALYTFEDADSLGADTSGNGPDLTPRNTPGQSSARLQEGSGSLALDMGDGLDAGAGELQVLGSAFTFGAWLYMTEDDSTNTFTVLGKLGSYAGYGAENWLGYPNCFVGDGAVWTNAQVVTAPWEPGTWLHLVCRYDEESGGLESYLGGDLRASANGAFAPTTVVFSISTPFQPFPGFVDEVFFVNAHVAPEAVRRIWACGVDGSLCACDEEDPATYVDCGRAAGDCSGLVPCNEVSP